MKKTFRLGTRGSPLALIQAQIVKDMLLAVALANGAECEISIVPIRTSGDWQPGNKEQSFLEIGGNKGLFTKEIEDALLSGMIDFAVHSMKDVSVNVPAGLVYAAMLERADPRDALLSPVAPRLSDLPQGARVGTSSLRRRAQLLVLRPDLTIVPLRGNVDTRMKKLAAEEADATVLAVAGLSRLSFLDRAASIFETHEMLPAAAQGILGVQIRGDNPALYEWVRTINHAPSEICGLCERAFLAVFDASCRTPIAAFAQVQPDNRLKFEALVVKPDGTQLIRRSAFAPLSDAEKLGQTLGQEIKAETPDDFFAM